ncbi:PRTRC system ThiF family protein [Photobacterium lutimaris]|uniref:PRTRC system ThiF family protein n=1 Tax=Photobacterium lutimaris TaxID=388278 RepID=A0A2T3ITJ4_9GAMM|nr:PRTRC system ThiF family protein [Photobacterium lutimaris]PSU31662.1 PRTRC system ThiF family protein [Photobacterium lutimaris]TDR72704.1 PRTRC genetic system ThiF family protein [Photobacterium lutimaris]
MTNKLELPSNLINKEINITLIGCGGTGSHIGVCELTQLDSTIKALGGKGIMVTMVDGSDVTTANLSRQRFFPHQVGSNKAEALTFIANNFYQKEWQCVPQNLDPSTLTRHPCITGADIIITAVDSASFRYQLHQATKDYPLRNKLWLDCGNDDVSGQVICGEMGCNRTVPCVTDLFDYSTIEDESAAKSCSAEESIARQTLGVNATAARHASQLLWNIIRFGETDIHGVFFNCLEMTSNPLSVCEEEWAIYGYTPTK